MPGRVKPRARPAEAPVFQKVDAVYHGSANEEKGADA